MHLHPPDRPLHRFPALLCPVVVAALMAGAPGATPAEAAPRRELSLWRTSLELPGAPAAVVAADLDGDGRRDLAVVVATTRWEEIGIEEAREMDRVEGLVEVLTVVPALLDRRELRVYRGTGGGGFELAADPLPLPPSVLSLEAGPEGVPVVALTDDGAAALRRDGEGLRLEPLVADPPVLAESGHFLPGLGMVRDLDGDGDTDLLLPARDGAAVYLAAPSGPAARPASRLPLPGDERLPGDASHYRRGPVRHYPLPEVEDVDGDGLPDLLLRHHQEGWDGLSVLRGLGAGRFATPVEPLAGRPADDEAEAVFVGDLDGDGRAEVVTAQELGEEEDASFREELAAAKRPRFALAIHRLGPALTADPQPARAFEVEGYAFGGGGDVRLPGGFQDLNGDRRLDLITLTLDFSLFEAVKVLTVHRIAVDLDFHLWCQQPDGSFRRVRGLDLSGTFRIDLDDLRQGELSLFAGDFDGDGRSDFVQLGRGKRVTIHRGRDDCSYPAEPDLTLDLLEEPGDLALVQVRDLDGDGRADLMVTQPQERDAPRRGEAGATPPVRLDLYLSGGGGR